MRVLVVVATVVLFVLALPILIPLAGISAELDHRRRRRAAESTPCQACGRVLGREALDRAEALSKEDRRWSEANPGVIPRRVRHVWAVCPHCGAKYDWDDERGFIPVPVSDLETPDAPDV